MGRRLFLLSCSLLVALIAVSRPHELDTDTTTATAATQTPSLYGRGGGLLSIVIDQALDLSALGTQVAALRAEVSSLTEELSAMGKSVLKTSRINDSKLKALQGSTFVHWGRSSCPNDTATVYSGYTSTKHHGHKGSGTNYLCLPSTPQFDDANYVHGGILYGVEYEIPGPNQDHNMPCSVCRAPEATTIMVPASLTCPVGWTFRYAGHLLSAAHVHYATEFVCLDSNPEHVRGEHGSISGAHAYLVKISCVGLPCPEYSEGKVVTCVVCSK